MPQLLAGSDHCSCPRAAPGVRYGSRVLGLVTLNRLLPPLQCVGLSRAVKVRMIGAGVRAIRTLSGNSSHTTEPAATMRPAPTMAPARNVARAPTHVPSPLVISSDRPAPLRRTVLIASALNVTAKCCACTSWRPAGRCRTDARHPSPYSAATN